MGIKCKDNNLRGAHIYLGIYKDRSKSSKPHKKEEPQPKIFVVASHYSFF